MKHPSPFLAALCLASTMAFAQSTNQDSIPPPPDIDAEGVPATRPVPPQAKDALQPAMPDTRPVRDSATRNRNSEVAEIEANSDSISELEQGSDRVVEYRQKGILRMVRITREDGSQRTYVDRNGDGRLDRDPLDGPVAPVYFKIYEWN